MAGPVNASDQAARDDAHLQSLGIKPELRRTLGFLSNFAIAFAFISVSTGSFGNFGGRHRAWRSGHVLDLVRHRRRPAARGPRVRRAGQPLPGRRVGLPVVEAVVEPRPRLVHRLVLLLGPGRDGQRGRGDRRVRDRQSRAAAGGPPTPVAYLDSPIPRRLHDDVRVHRDRRRSSSRRSSTPTASDCCRSSTTSAWRPRSSGMLVFALILLLFANVQPAIVLTSMNGAEAAQNGNIPADVPARHVHGGVHRLRLRHRRDRSARRRVDAGRQAPRGVLSSILISGLVGVIFIPAVILASPDITATMEEGAAGGFPIGTIIAGAFHAGAPLRDHVRRALPVRHPRLGLRLHDGDPGRRDAG